MVDVRRAAGVYAFGSANGHLVISIDMPRSPHFRINSPAWQRVLPFVPRGAYAEYLKFSDRERTLLIEPGTAGQLRAAAVRALPNETGGFLAGRSLCDEEGRYVVVSGFAEARPGSGGPAAFEIPAEDLAALRAENARANPDADEAGWWHSHPAPSGFSLTDFGTQRWFGQDDSVGLLVFASGAQWGAAYMGPNAAYLGSLRLGPDRGWLSRFPWPAHRGRGRPSLIG